MTVIAFSFSVASVFTLDALVTGMIRLFGVNKARIDQASVLPSPNT